MKVNNVWVKAGIGDKTMTEVKFSRSADPDLEPTVQWVCRNFDRPAELVCLGEEVVRQHEGELFWIEVWNARNTERLDRTEYVL